MGVVDGSSTTSRKRGRHVNSVIKMTMSSLMLTPQKQKNISSSKNKKSKRNCHPHRNKHLIKLKCSKCGMGFCSAALKRFPWLEDPKTGWSCPCCTGACECKYCLTKKKRDSAELLSRVQRLTVERDGYKKQLDGERDEYKAYTADCVSILDELRGRYSILEDHCSQLEHELVERKTAGINSLRKECEQQNRIISELRSRLLVAESEIVEGEKTRKKLHNTILELKGNIRVFVRVRPLLDCDANGAQPTFSYPRSVDPGRQIMINHAGKKHLFTFDKVFGGDSSQEDIFLEICELVQSAIDGYEVSLFAYGQTGSGKTFTLMGGSDDLQKGLIPRSFEQIFLNIEALSAQGCAYTLQASMLEIYNEKVFDLLAVRGKEGCPCDVRFDKDGKPSVPDAEVVNICSLEKLSQLLVKASKKRSVARTKMNDTSSRSHFLVMLKIHGVNKSSGEQVNGSLCFIDLAGSESPSTSGTASDKDRFEETKAINRSLTFLGSVISAMARKADHIPFKNSILTRLLQPCLEGDRNKTLMFVNVSPNPESSAESLSSLRFAEQVNSCEVGVARRRV